MTSKRGGRGRAEDLEMVALVVVVLLLAVLPFSILLLHFISLSIIFLACSSVTSPARISFINSGVNFTVFNDGVLTRPLLLTVIFGCSIVFSIGS